MRESAPGNSDPRGCTHVRAAYSPSYPLLRDKRDGVALPLLARSADCDRVADRHALSEHEVELPLGGLDHDSAGLNRTLVAHDLAGAGRGAEGAWVADRVGDRAVTRACG